MDTLEIAKKLEGAGFDRQQAEAVAAVVAGAESVRDKQLDEIRDAVLALGRQVDGVGTKIAAQEPKLAALESKFDAQLAKARTEIIIWMVGALGVFAAILRII